MIVHHLLPIPFVSIVLQRLPRSSSSSQTNESTCSIQSIFALCLARFLSCLSEQGQNCESLAKCLGLSAGYGEQFKGSSPGMGPAYTYCRQYGRAGRSGWVSRAKVFEPDGD